MIPKPTEAVPDDQKSAIEKLTLEDFLNNREQRQFIGAGPALKDAKNIAKFPQKQRSQNETLKQPDIFN